VNGRLYWSLRALVAATGAIPWLLAAAHSRPVAAVALFHGLCHQLPEKTLSLGGGAMLVCSRCAGIYAGVALGALVPAPRSWCPASRRLLLAAALLLLADVILQATGTIPILHAARLTTGALAGWVASALLFAWLRLELGDAEDRLNRGGGA